MDRREQELKKQRRLEERRRRRRRRRIIQVILTALLIIIMAVMVLLIYHMGSQKKGGENSISSQINSGSPQDIDPTPTPETVPTPEATPEPTPTPVPVQQISGEQLYSSNAYLIRLRDQAVMLDKAGEDPVYPASLTKIMTVLTALDNLPDLDEKVVLSDDMIKSLYRQGASMAGFVGGEQVTVRDLLYGAMLPSGADACVGLAQKISGSEEAFVELMNQKASEIGMGGTHFVNSTGLHDENHYSTCQDISRLLAKALENETFREIFTAESYTTSQTPPNPSGIELKNSMFQKMNSRELSNGGAIEGGKTGYTDAAQLCLGSLAKVGEEEYVLITVHAVGNQTTDPYHILDAFAVYNQIQ